MHDMFFVEPEESNTFEWRTKARRVGRFDAQQDHEPSTKSFASRAAEGNTCNVDGGKTW